MLRSLRFRLPALFLLGIVLSGLVAPRSRCGSSRTTRETQTIAELRSESIGIVQLYAQPGRAREPCRVHEARAGDGGDRIYYVPVVPGAQLFRPLAAAAAERRST